MLRRIVIFFYVLLSCHVMWSQGSELDSLSASSLQQSIVDQLEGFTPDEAEAQLPRLSNYLARTNQWNDLGALYFDFASSFYGAKKIDKAIQYTNLVDSLYQINKITDANLSYKAVLYSSTFLVSQKKLDEAKQKCLVVVPKLEASKDTVLLAMASNLLGNIFYYQRQLSTATEWYQRYCDLQPEKFVGYRNLSNVFTELGNEERATKNLLRAKKIIEKAEPSHINNLYLISTLAILSRNATQSDELLLGKLYIDQALATIPKLPESLQQHNIILEFYSDALQHATAARDTAQLIHFLNQLEANPNVSTCVSYGHVANYYERIHAYDEQLKYTSKLDACMESQGAYKTSPAYKNFYTTHHCRALIRQGQWEEAIHLANSNFIDTLDINFHPDIEQTLASSRNQNILQAKSWAALRAFRADGNKNYLDISRHSCELLDTLIFHTIRQQASKITTIKYHRNYGMAQQIAAEDWLLNKSRVNYNKALSYSEKMRSLYLMSHVNALAQQGQEDPFSNLQLRERKLQEFLTYIKEGISTIDSNNRALLPQLDSVNEALINIRSQIKEANPDYHKYRFNNTQPKLSAIQRQLKGSQKLLSISVFDEIAVVFEITRKAANIHVNPVADLSQHIDSLLFQLHHQGASYQPWLFKINQHLLKGIDLKSHQDFIVIPDLELSNIPFQLLIQEENPKATIQNTHSISWWQSGKTPEESTDGVLAMSATVNNLNSSSFVNATRDYLTFLPNVTSEIKNIQDILGSSVTTVNQATKKEFINSASKFGVIHLAMHSIMHNKKPAHSHLVFYDDSNSTANNLYSYEIRNLTIPAQLVCLSSCNSGTGKYIDGEGVASLGLAFNYAGCSNTVQSLWPVSDASTSVLMKFFYKNMRDGLSKPAALAEAKRQFVAQAPANLRHPYYWAGFVYYGDDLPLNIKSRNYWYWLLGLVILIGVWFWWRGRTVIR